MRQRKEVKRIIKELKNNSNISISAAAASGRGRMSGLHEVVQKDPIKFIRFTCCGKRIHFWCNDGIKVSSLSHEQKRSCPLCCTKYPKSHKETTKRLRPWVEKGKLWAQSMLGQKYYHGIGVDQSYQQAKELFELAASQGKSTSHVHMQMVKV